ncbi:MAG TPA: hypothetical protein VG269_02215 [Tepidisphaeraceae bacterium]|jgi:hypothetical protein|nr:hypothetical protein [Tepidisphaeraceae bacterium]
MKRFICLGVVLACVTLTMRGWAQVTLPDPNAGASRENREMAQAWLKQQLAMRERAFDQARQALDQRHDELMKIQSELHAATGRADVSPEGLQKAASRLDEEMESMTLDEVGSKARADALAKTIAEQTERAKATAQDDPAGAELMALLKVRENQLALLQQRYKQGIASITDVQQAEAALAEAKAGAAERRRAIVTGPAADGVATWNRELLNLTIAEKERQARLGYIQARLKTLAEAMPKVEQLQNIREAMKASMMAAERSRMELEQFRMSAQENLNRRDGASGATVPPPPPPATESK